MAPNLTKDSPIVIVGAGAFAIHLAQRGYHDVTLTDQQNYRENGYSYDKGCDAASAGSKAISVSHSAIFSPQPDINKVVRASYGPLTDYQEAALASIKSWKTWNEQIREGRNLPPTFTKEDVLFVNNGTLEMISDKCLTRSMKDSIINMEHTGYLNTQLVLTNASDAARAKKLGFSINPLNRPPSENYGTLDSLGGFVYADKACQFALHTAKSRGVKTVLGGKSGTFQSFIRENDGKVTGIVTADGVHRAADLVIMACGGWTPTLLPQLDHLCETTAGSVCIFQLPNDTALWQRIAPERFPTWAYDLHHGQEGGLYKFPRDSNGIVKVGYRGTKYTNPQRQADGIVRSVPVTR